MKKEQNKKSFFSKWLEKLQQESWQLELLISGLALFGIWVSDFYYSDWIILFRSSPLLP